MGQEIAFEAAASLGEIDMTHRHSNVIAAVVAVTGILAANAEAQEAPRSFVAQNGLPSDERFAAARDSAPPMIGSSPPLAAH